MGVRIFVCSLSVSSQLLVSCTGNDGSDVVEKPGSTLGDEVGLSTRVGRCPRCLDVMSRGSSARNAALEWNREKPLKTQIEVCSTQEKERTVFFQNVSVIKDKEMFRMRGDWRDVTGKYISWFQSGSSVGGGNMLQTDTAGQRLSCGQGVGVLRPRPCVLLLAALFPCRFSLERSVHGRGSCLFSGARVFIQRTVGCLRADSYSCFCSQNSIS